MVPPRPKTVQTGFLVSRPTRFHNKRPFVYGAVTRYGHTFQGVPLNRKLLKG